MDKVELRTERLLLRAPSPSDVEAITAACQDPEIQRRIPIPVPYTRSDAERYVTIYSDSGWASGKSCTWAITIADEFVGAIGLDGIGSEQATIGYWLAVSSRGRGLLTEAAQAVVEFGFARPPQDWASYASSGMPTRAMLHPLASLAVSAFTSRGHFGSVP